MSTIYILFNALECVTWSCLGIWFAVQAGRGHGPRWIALGLATGFLLFGLSDFAEAFGSGELPWWLWAWKIGVGLAIFALLLRREYARRGRAALGKMRFAAAGVILALAVYSISVGRGHAAEKDAPHGATALDLRAQLASALPEVRDKAAAQVRATYRPIPQSRWTPVVEKLKKGLTRTQVLEVLKSYNIDVMSARTGSFFKYAEQYQLDDEWALICGYEDRGDVLIEAALTPMMRWIYIKAPPNFTGCWTTYYINGQKYQAIDFQNGQYLGACTLYSSDGAVAEERHNNKKGWNGPYLGYYPSGKKRFQGEYKDGKRVGIWTFYDEAGTVTNTENQDKSQ